ncbi:MAG: hypothetical protein E7164_03160 [Firmicutes bacterium]|nr:hypothetical protein [Bacillota bacterium]
MLNKHGQSLVTFIILLPLILLLFGLGIEKAYVSYQKNKLISVTKSIIANSIEEKDKNDIILLYDKNDIGVSNLVIDGSYGLKVSFVSNVDSFLGKKYEVKISILGYEENGKIYYKKG